jgi:hypothetical protein
MRGAQRVSHGLTLGALLLAMGPDAVGQATQGDGGPTVDKSICLAQHEASQLLRRGGKLVEAREALVVCSREACPSFVRADCVDWLAEVDRSVPSVVLSAQSTKGDEPDVRVSIDGRLVATRLDGKSFDLNPGVHLFRFELPPQKPIEQQVLVAEGDKNRRIAVTFVNPEAERKVAPPLPERPSSRAESRPVPVAVYALGGVALVGVAGFTYFGLSAKHDRDSLTGSCAPFCDSSSVGNVKTKLLLADIALGAAALSAGVGVYLFLSRPASPVDPKVGAALTLEPTAQGPRVLLRGRF